MSPADTITESVTNRLPPAPPLPPKPLMSFGRGAFDPLPPPPPPPPPPPALPTRPDFETHWIPPAWDRFNSNTPWTRDADIEMFADTPQHPTPSTSLFGAPSPPLFPHTLAADTRVPAWTEECEKLKRQIQDLQDAFGTLRADFDRAESTRKSEASVLGDAEGASSSAQDKGKGRAAEPVWHHAFVSAATPINPFSAQQAQSFAERAKQVNQSIQAKVVDFNAPTVPFMLQPPTSITNPTVISPISPDPALCCGYPAYTCDSCFKPIWGTAYRCLDCADFEFCDTCAASPSLRDLHGIEHPFYPIPSGNTNINFEAARSKHRGEVHQGAKCDGCGSNIWGVRHRCLSCSDFDFCDKCITSVEIRSQHDMHHAFFPIEKPWNREGYDLAKDCHKALNPTLPVHSNVTCDGCRATVVGVRHKCLSCSDFDFCQNCIADPTKRFAHDLSHAFLPVPKPGDLPDLLAARTVSNEPPPPVIHDNIKCDNCSDTVIGVRYKCLDCPDFDLCELCVGRGAKDAHNVEHQFVELATPGRVIVHTVWTPEPQPAPAPIPVSEPVPVPPPAEPYVHNARCDLCDSRIRGDRYVSSLRDLVWYEADRWTEMPHLPGLRYLRELLLNHPRRASLPLVRQGHECQ